VHRGDVIALVDTHKGAIEIEVFEDGVVEEILVPPGERILVGNAMARLGPLPAERQPPEAARRPEQEPSPAPAVERAPEPAAEPPAQAPPAPSMTPPRLPPPAVEPTRTRPPARLPGRGTGPGGAVTLEDVRRAAGAPQPSGAAPVERAARVRASPIARRMAETLGIDLERVRGSGAHGTIVKADIERLATSGNGAPAAPAAPAAVTSTDQTGSVGAPPSGAAPSAAMRQAIAAAVARSNREIPHYYLATRVDMSGALAWIEKANRNRPSRELLLPAALQLRAVALALREFPDFNGFWVDDAFRPGNGIHIGVAVSLRGGGLVVPAIHDADKLSADELMRALADVVSRARTGSLRSSEVMDATITVTNLGDRGVESVFGVIYPPQVALVGFGRIVEQPWAAGGLLGVRPVVHATLAADHRASDGHRGGLFLSAIGRKLADSEST
jgi:pyruvate dehydrogenase E2 component (dihydrolipoamide acetyltransferase)